MLFMCFLCVIYVFFSLGIKKSIIYLCVFTAFLCVFYALFMLFIFICLFMGFLCFLVLKHINKA